MATSEAHTVARELYATVVSTALSTSVNQLRTALPKLSKAGSDADPVKAVKAALPRGISSDVRNFLVSLAEQGILDQLPEIIAALEGFSHEAPEATERVADAPASPSSSPATPRSAASLSAEVVSSDPLTEAQQRRLTNHLQQIYGSDLDLHFVEEASVTSGMIIRVRDQEAANKLSGAFSEIIQLLQQGEERLTAEVVSAVPLTQTQRDRIARELRQQYDTRLDLHFREDESLIGGLVIRIGDQVLDSSLRARLGTIQRNMLAS